MNKRFCKLGQYAARAFFLFAMCGATYSCKDDYFYDDENPSWLGSSIYEYLESQGNYTNFVRLIDDLEYKEVLARTGSKTLFVADDDAFNTFYQTNAWGVRSYDQLTRNQKKLLLNGVMINNAYLLEMMSSTAATGGDNSMPNAGECLRRETAADVTDSITRLFAQDIPMSYNQKDKDYWERFRSKGIYLAMDGTAPMMTHFLATQMAKKGITNEDFRRIVGQDRGAKDAFIYNSRVLEQDITCQNGYVNRLDRVLVTPQNMAEMIRTDNRTKIFSHMIDRFSAPFYNAALTERYRLLFGNDVDSVFQKRYFSNRSQGGVALKNDLGTNPLGDATGNDLRYVLNFDPGWNAYDNSTYDKEQDMGVIFCPTDSKLMDYFFSLNGGGRFLLKAYAPDLVESITPSTADLNLVYRAIDQIPLDVIEALINNLMKPSFVNAVPSKFEIIKNDAQDPMFDEVNDYHRNSIVDVLLANNGVVYLMDEVVSPAKYAAVSAPAYVDTNKKIFKWANESDKLCDIYTNYSVYLLAMSARFSFLVPTDNDFIYVDPLSFYHPNSTDIPGTLIGRAYKYTWDVSDQEGDEGKLKVESHEYHYNLATQTGTYIEEPLTEDVSKAAENRLKDMLETHTIIHEDNSEITGIDETATGMECNKHYFISKNNTPVYIENASARNNGMKAKGGLQILTGESSSVTEFDDKSAQTNGYGNGYAYAINKPLLPTIESVFSVLYNNPDFSSFFELCQTDPDIFGAKGLNLSTAESEKYNIFKDDGGLPCYSRDGIPVPGGTNVRFFNNYQYTLYVPTNEAMRKAHEQGLPTWQDVRDLFGLDADPDDVPILTPEETEARKLKATAMITAIVNFVKTHFQDKTIFADTTPLNSATYETAALNSETGLYSKVKVQGGGGNLTVQDETAGSRPVSITSNKNIIARDYIVRNVSGTDVKPGGTEAGNALKITASSSVAIHGIDGVLNYKNYENGRYDSDWATEAKARNYLKQYRLIK